MEEYWTCRSVTWMRRFASGRKEADKRKSRQSDGVCLTTVRLALGEPKREELAVKGLERRTPLSRAMRSSHVTERLKC